MIAAVLNKIKNFEVREDYPIPKLEKDDVLVQVAYCGICGTDKLIYDGNFEVKMPIVTGHEYSGTIVDIGAGLGGFRIDDKVAVNPNIHCGYCRMCKVGKIQFCLNHKALGVTENGGFAEFSAVPVSQLYGLSADTDLSVAAFAEPLSCCLRGMEHAKIKHGESVVIVGGGSIGQIMLQLAKNSAASKVLLVEPIESKRRLALELGADLSLDPFEDKFLNQFYNFTNGGADVVIECVGKKEAVELTVDLAAKGGRVVIFGLTHKNEKATFDLNKLFNKEIQINNSFLNPFTFQQAIDLISENKLPLSILISKQTEISSISDAFDSSENSFLIKQQIFTKPRSDYETKI
ncbi:MAG: zinc-dependent alcohol dehydrogenase family protein [Melioribacteraceae bacterium]|nr:zinc-dependent alcohol dehydrogenase family protein [Melioribacteraceae bacterium]MCF8264832.1 zinc-dependent alcohol dehydrogenase family protein [Melioribacteraceae bacterium]MCF8431749.1 zinc-dependent alcohol dehydrogenase family protein [Melioribacteraceae bacterium]